MSEPYTPESMEAARADPDAPASRFDSLQAEASAAVGSSATALREIRERYREAYAEALTNWQDLRAKLDASDRGQHDPRPGRRTLALRDEVEALGERLDAYRSMLARLELAERTLARTSHYLEDGDDSLATDGEASAADEAVAMRIVEAQEAERSRLAQEIHDGPAQALTNAIFQAEYVERLGDADPMAMLPELRDLRDLLRRELNHVRSFISQLRPPFLDELGLNGAIREAAEHLRTPAGVTVTTNLTAPTDDLDERQQTVALRIVQEALQNARKHAVAAIVVVATERMGEHWIVEIRDDGRGFDTGAAVARGRRNFGLRFMRERADAIGARFDVRSRPDGGTVVRLAIPLNDTTGMKEDG